MLNIIDLQLFFYVQILNLYILILKTLILNYYLTQLAYYQFFNLAELYFLFTNLLIHLYFRFVLIISLTLYIIFKKITNI